MKTVFTQEVALMSPRRRVVAEDSVRAIYGRQIGEVPDWTGHPHNKLILTKLVQSQIFVMFLLISPHSKALPCKLLSYGYH